MKTAQHKHTASLDDPVPDVVLAAINHVQQTSWRINQFNLEVVTEAYLGHHPVRTLPRAYNLDLPARYSDADWAKMSKDEQSDHIAERREIHGDNARSLGKRESLLRQLTLADRFVDRDIIYFPHALDFRGRMYPLPSDLHPQSDDLGRSLLMFAEGQPIGDEGREHLARHVANMWGLDKEPFDEKFRWVVDHETQIRESISDPFKSDWWQSAEEPFQFLAAAREWALLLEAKSSREFLTHLPVHVDGTCNGLQHLSAMGLDPVGAFATNLTAHPDRQDIYQIVADKVRAVVEKDASRGVAEAIAWQGRVNRKVCKRAVMTVPYGVTAIGMRDQLLKHKDKLVPGQLDKSLGRPTQNANYLRDVLVAAIAETVVAARELMDWFQVVAHDRSIVNAPVEWTAPSGFKVRQAYHKMAMTQVRTLIGNGPVNKKQYRTHLWHEDDTLGINTRKQVQSVAPNVIHSFDAAHLALAVAAAADEGVNAFSIVHDSFGCHAGQIETMGRILRETFVSIYETDWLKALAAEFGASYVPQRGDFDIQQVLNAPYFFA